jgi:hypothetical protein
MEYFPKRVAGAAKSIATGSYTGNGTDGRQITVGFQCSLVIIHGAPGGVTEEWILIPNYSIQHEGYQTGPGTEAIHYSSTVRTYLHASDGFVVSNTVTAGTLAGSNRNLDTYYYWAISL